LKGRGFRRYRKHLVLKGRGFRRYRKHLVLKGRGFSRAITPQKQPGFSP